MDALQAFILGMVQGLTEYLPVSSSGHLTIGQYFFGVTEDNLIFTIVVHVATVFSTLFILREEVAWLIFGCWTSIKNGFQWNEEMKYMSLILLSMIPVGIVGLFFKDFVEEIFGSGLFIVGCMLLLTSALLAFSYYAKPRVKEQLSYKDAFIIGLSQACAVMRALSRSGTTIATGLLLGNKKEKLAQFSFLMVIPPILGEALLDCIKVAKDGFESVAGGISPMALVIGFVSAFVFGCLACKWMLDIVKKGKLIYFSIYCAIVGVLVICMDKL
mgnify:CR=1 FL=1